MSMIDETHATPVIHVTTEVEEMVTPIPIEVREKSSTTAHEMPIGTPDLPRTATRETTEVASTPRAEVTKTQGITESENENAIIIHAKKSRPEIMSQVVKSAMTISEKKSGEPIIRETRAARTTEKRREIETCRGNNLGKSREILVIIEVTLPRGSTKAEIMSPPHHHHLPPRDRGRNTTKRTILPHAMRKIMGPMIPLPIAPPRVAGTPIRNPTLGILLVSTEETRRIVKLHLHLQMRAHMEVESVHLCVRRVCGIHCHRQSPTVPPTGCEGCEGCARRARRAGCERCERHSPRL